MQIVDYFIEGNLIPKNFFGQIVSGIIFKDPGSNLKVIMVLDFSILWETSTNLFNTATLLGLKVNEDKTWLIVQASFID